MQYNTDLLVATAMILAFQFAMDVNANDSNSEIASFKQPRDREPVSWVNSDLPPGEGLEHFVLASEALGHEVGYVVFTPEGYMADGDEPYPVVYFLHGMGGTEASDSGGFSGLLARGIREGTLPPVICVFPNGGRSGYMGDVEKMIVDELIPLIDAEYATDVSCRAVVGFSMGGQGAVHLSVLHPELFCACGSWGGGMWRGEEEMLAAASDHAATLRENHFAALLINGDQDRPDAFASMASVLAQHDIACEVQVLPDTPHNLGLYYERGGVMMLEFLGEALGSGGQ